MKSALQLELQDLHGLHYIATIIWFVLLGISLLAIVFYQFNKKKPPKENNDEVSISEKKPRPKGF